MAEAKRRFHVGNLYFNRKCTGALVGVHPFGGFNMSGTDSKAGGRDYLLLLTQAKTISEKV
jgi:1-pyrroline-5-carboxylate dehydrogenase